MSDARKNPANTINDVVRNEHRTADILEALTKGGWVFAHKDDLPSPKADHIPDVGKMVRSAEYRPEREDFLNPVIGRQPEASKVEQEPYAWAIEVDGTARGLFYEKTEAGFDANIEGGVVQPLYTQPAPASDELLEALEGVRRALIPCGVLNDNVRKAATIADRAIAKHKGASQ